MEDRKIRHNGEEVATSCLPQSIPQDSINTWKNEVWLAKNSEGKTIYLKNKTWQNCWLKYGMITIPKEENKQNATEYSYLFINTDGSYAQFRFPDIINLQDYIERGGYLGHIVKQAQNSNSFIEELYRVVPLVDWSKHSKTYIEFKSWNFLGNLYFTHAYDNKGVNLGARGWRDPWVFNFKTRPKSAESWQGYCLSYFLAGSNISNVEFRFGDGVRIYNAQGMFKALQVPLNLKISDLSGSPLNSTKERGFSPDVISDLFKQTGQNIVKTPNNISYANVHSAGNMVQETWGLREISSFMDRPLGDGSEENTLTIGRPDNNYIDGPKTYPNFGRSNYSVFAGAYGLEKIGPLVDLKYLDHTDAFNNSPNIREMRVRNLNFGDWNFSQLTKLDEASVKYLLNNVWDRQRGFDELTKVEGQSEEVIKRTKNTYLVQDKIRKTITCPSQWSGYITQDIVDLVIDRGWNLVVGGVTKERSPKVRTMTFRSANGFEVNEHDRTITYTFTNGGSSLGVAGAKLPFDGDYDRIEFAPQNGNNAIQLTKGDDNTFMLGASNTSMKWYEDNSTGIKIYGLDGQYYTLKFSSVEPETRELTITSNGEGLLKYTINGMEYTQPQVHRIPVGTRVDIVAYPKPDNLPESGSNNGAVYSIVSVDDVNGTTKTIDSLTENKEVVITSSKKEMMKVTFTVYNSKLQNSVDQGYIEIETI